MSASTSRHRGGRRRGTGEAGFALLATLGLMALAGLVVLALLGLVLTSVKATAQAGVAVRELRAADGALEAAVNRIRMDPSAGLGTGIPGAACDSGTTWPLDVTLDGVTASVTCTAQPSSGTVVRAVPLGTDPATVKVVGDAYNGLLWSGGSWKTNCPAGSSGPGCFPWTFGIGAANHAAYGSQITGYNTATVVSSGKEALALAGNVQVKKGAAVLNNQGGATPTAVTPGVRVGGEYQQGDSGLFSGQGGANSCGIYSATHPWNVAASTIADIDASPDCNVAAMQALSNDNSGSAPVTAAQIAAMTVRSAPSSCPGAATYTFQPGVYGAAETAKMNDLFASGTTCHRTWIFAPGNYYLDVDDLSAAAGERNALLLGDPTSYWVFGVPTFGGAANDAVFPEACHHDGATGHDGVSVTLSARTSIHHSAGRVAMCGQKLTSSPLAFKPVLWQAATTVDGWLGRPTSASSTQYSNPGNVVAGPDGSVATATVTGCTFGCSGDRTIATLWPSSSNASNAPLGVVSIDVTGDADDANGTDATTAFDVYSPASSPTPLCSTQFSKVPDGGMTVSYDLRRGSGNCNSYLTTWGNLNNAKIVMRQHLDSSCWFFCDGTISEEIDSIVLNAGKWVAKATTVTSAVASDGTPDWNNVGNVSALDGASARANVDCFLGFICFGNDARTLTLNNLTDQSPTNPLTPNQTLTSAQVAVVGTDFLLSVSNQLTLTLNFAAGGSCQVVYDDAPLEGETGSYNLLDAGHGNCASVLTKSEQLVGASLTVKVRESCFFSICIGFSPPSIDFVGITTTSHTYGGPGSPFQIRVNNDHTSASDALFTAFGPVSIPRNDLDVRWAGPVKDPSDTTSTVPPAVINGDLTVKAIGSDTDTSNAATRVGVLCCGPARQAERIVTLSATIGGVVRATATVRIVDADPLNAGYFKAGGSVGIIEWNLCKPICAA